MHHNLKTLPAYFNSTLAGFKNFEVRKDDRDYQVGDTITLQEWSRGHYTRRSVFCRIKYVLRGFYGLTDGYVAIGLDIDS